jgi:hypothetical protein
MRLTLDERPYSGKTFRPRPEIFLDSQAGILIIATPWGPRSAARKVIDRMQEYLLLSRDDREVTSPFQRLTCLSTQANNLRIAAMLANEMLYREDNKLEYRSGVELFAAIMDDEEFVWLQAGTPQVFLGRRNQSLLPLGLQVDLSFDFSNDNSVDQPSEIALDAMLENKSTTDLLPVLPSHLLGLDLSINLSLNSFRSRHGDRLYLLSHSQPPEAVFTMKNPEIDFMCGELARSQPDLGFWLGVAQINKKVK